MSHGSLALSPPSLFLWFLDPLYPPGFPDTEFQKSSSLVGPSRDSLKTASRW